MQSMRAVLHVLCSSMPRSKCRRMRNGAAAAPGSGPSRGQPTAATGSRSHGTVTTADPSANERETHTRPLTSASCGLRNTALVPVDTSVWQIFCGRWQTGHSRPLCGTTDGRSGGSGRQCKTRCLVLRAGKHLAHRSGTKQKPLPLAATEPHLRDEAALAHPSKNHDSRAGETCLQQHSSSKFVKLQLEHRSGTQAHSRRLPASLQPDGSRERFRPSRPEARVQRATGQQVQALLHPANCCCTARPHALAPGSLCRPPPPAVAGKWHDDEGWYPARSPTAATTVPQLRRRPPGRTAAPAQSPGCRKSS